MHKYYVSFFGKTSVPVCLWGKLYKTEILKNKEVEFFPKDGYKMFMGDDLWVNIQVMPKANSIGIVNKCLYNYRVGGGTSKFNKYFMEDYSYIKYIQKLYINKYSLEKKVWHLMNVESVNVFRTYVESLIRQSGYDKEKIILEIEKAYEFDFIKETIIYFERVEYAGKFQDNVRLLKNRSAKEYYDFVNCIEDRNKYKNMVRGIIKKLL